MWLPVWQTLPAASTTPQVLCGVVYCKRSSGICVVTELSRLVEVAGLLEDFERLDQPTQRSGFHW